MVECRHSVPRILMLILYGADVEDTCLNLVMQIRASQTLQQNKRFSLNIKSALSYETLYVYKIY